MELRGQPRGPAIDDTEAGRLLNAVLDGGINLIDTSIDYGRSEELIGRYVGHRSDEYFLASKCGCLPATRPPVPARRFPTTSGPTTSGPGSTKACAGWAPTAWTCCRCISPRAVSDWRPTGRSRPCRPCGTKARSALSACRARCPHLPDHIAMGVFDVFQIPYSAVQPEHESLITAAAEAGAGTLIRGGAARGAPADDKKWRQGPIGLSEGEGQRRWESSGMEDLLGEMSRVEFVLRFTLSHPGLSSTIVGTSRLAHLRSNLAVAEKGPLPADLYQQAKRQLEAVSA